MPGFDQSSAAWLSPWPKRPTKKKGHPTASAERRILPMELQIGDRLTDETGEWEIIGPPYTTRMGKNVHVRVKRVENAEVTTIRTYAARERISVHRHSLPND